MNLENMNTFAQVYNLQVIAGLGVGGGNKLVRLETLDQNIGTWFVYHNFFDFFISLKENWYLKNPSVE